MGDSEVLFISLFSRRSLIDERNTNLQYQFTAPLPNMSNERTDLTEPPLFAKLAMPVYRSYPFARNQAEISPRHPTPGMRTSLA